MPRTNQRDINLASRFIYLANTLINKAMELLGQDTGFPVDSNALDEMLLDTHAASREHRRQPTARMVKGSRA